VLNAQNEDRVGVLKYEGAGGEIVEAVYFIVAFGPSSLMITPLLA
jgi:hypothetical protein